MSKNMRNTVVFYLLVLVSLVSMSGVSAYNSHVATPQSQLAFSIICEQCMPESKSCEANSEILSKQINYVWSDAYDSCLEEVISLQCAEGIPTVCFEAFDTFYGVFPLYG